MTSPVTPRRAGPRDPAGDLLEATVAYGDRWFDDARGLVWNPAGSFAPVVPDASVHLLPQSAWYAFGLLERDRPGDLGRATRVLEEVLACQYNHPGEVWHGTFAQVAESPQPPLDAQEWVHYDPNWRQFIGTTLVLVLKHHEARLDPLLVARIERALANAVEGEPDDRVSPAYSNIAILKAVLDVEVGARLGMADRVAAGERLAAQVTSAIGARGALAEFNSPTYAGIDLVGLRMWRTTAASERLRHFGDDVEAALWEDLALFFHADLGNLAGPYTRTYGMDLGRYLGAVGLWWWARWGREGAPLPDLGATSIDHGHDLLAGPLVARLERSAGAVGAPWVAELARHFEGVRQVERIIEPAANRVATAWLEPDVALGGEDGDTPAAAWGQAAPATVHWSLGVPASTGIPAVGTVRLHCGDPVTARAGDGVLRIRSHPRTGPPDDLVFWIDAPPAAIGDRPWLVAAMVGPSRWDLPGLTLGVHTAATLTAVETFGTGLLVTYRPSGPVAEAPRVVLRRVVDP